MQIPIENIYYLLSYAWNTLEEKERVPVSIDDRTTLLDLFAKILINSTRILVKRGIDKSYIPVTDEVAGIKGKLELGATLKAQLHMRQKTICSFDEFSPNILTNRILLSTFLRLLKTKNLDVSLKRDILALLPVFGEVRPIIPITPSVFQSVRLNRNNRFYGFVLNVCRIIIENVRPSEKAGEWQFSDFRRDENKMNRLFEKFVYNYYSLETGFKVRSENIQWQFSSPIEDNRKFLPKMVTDVTLESPDRKIIIDAKFYRETLVTNFTQPKIRSSHLYQLFSYLLNQRALDNRTHTAVGILLYPTIGEDYDLKFGFETHSIFLRTVDLNRNWLSIDRRLKMIVDLI
jgi:5-methylcytosine-specific restriction enzyme subunit McrC